MNSTNTKPTLRRILALAVLASLSLYQSAKAATIYADEASFVAAMSGAPYYLNDFSSLPKYDRIITPLQCSGSDITYSISCPPEGLWSMDRELATYNQSETMRISVLSGDGWAVGGDFYLTDEYGNPMIGLVTVTLSDGTTTNFVCSDDPLDRPFVGFISSGAAITWVQVSGQGNRPCPTIANLYAARNPVAFAPSVTVPYPSVPAWLGGAGIFQADATGRPPFYYQLLKDGVPVVGGTNFLLVFPNVKLADYNSSFAIRVTNYFGVAVVSNLSIYPTTIAAWGWNEYGQRQTPPGLTNVWQVSAGLWHNLCLKSSGTVAAWGRNLSGQTNVPPGLSNVTAVAAGWHHSLALRGDGTVVGWGDNGPGQTNVPAGLTNAMAISAGNYFSLALRSSGAVVGWGANWYGQTNVPPSLTNALAIAAGGDHSLALRANGTVVAWGLNEDNQTNVPPSLTNVVAVAAGCNHSLALKSNGTVVGWGRNWDGQATPPPGLSNVVAIAAGSYHSLAIRADGSVVVWGNNWAGQTNVPPGLTNGLSASCSYGDSLVVVGNGPLLRQATALNLTRAPSSFSLQIQTRSGCVYQLEYKDTVFGNTWTSFPLVAGNGGVKTFTDPSASGATRFYRVRSW